MKKPGVVITGKGKREQMFYTLLMLSMQSLKQSEYAVYVLGKEAADEAWKKEFGLEWKAIANLSEVKEENVILLEEGVVPGYEDFIETYARALESTDDKTVLMGYTTWHASVLPDRFRVWLERGQKKLRAHEKVAPREFRAESLALPKRIALTRSKGGGELEWAYDLRAEGVRIVFLPEASAGRLEQMTEEEYFADAKRRMKEIKHFVKKYPQAEAGKCRLVKYEWIRKMLGRMRKEWGWWAQEEWEWLEEK